MEGMVEMCERDDRFDEASSPVSLSVAPGQTWNG